MPHPNDEPVFLLEHWQELCERVAEKSMALAAYLIDAEPVFDIQNILVIRVRIRLHYEMLTTERYRRLLEDVLRSFSKREHRMVKIIYQDALPAIVVASLPIFDANRPVKL